MTLKEGGPQELPILYDSCAECAPDTYFTLSTSTLRSTLGSPLDARRPGRSHCNANMPPGVALTQVHAGLADPNGRQLVGTWSHFDYGGQKPPQDYIYRYDLDPLAVWSARNCSAPRTLKP